MANTIPGGAYLDPDKKTWRDANGKVIAAPKDLSKLYKLREPAPEPPEPPEQAETVGDEVTEGQPSRARRITKKS